VAPEAAAVLGALPVAAVVLDHEDRFRFANPAAELFFQHSAGSLTAMSLRELLPPDNRLFGLLAQVRHHEAPVYDHDLILESPRLRRFGVAAQGAPLPELHRGVVLTLQDASTAQMLDRQLNFRGAARGASAMAAMLAHEVKNPLSGIRGAAQLLEQGANEGDRELCQLIQDEADRIRTWSSGWTCSPTARSSAGGQHPRGAGPCPAHRAVGLRRASAVSRNTTRRCRRSGATATSSCRSC
jgi:two-component system nitrogen regulation sensor histidine kinase GlnL